MDMSTRSENRENEDVWDFGKMKVKNYYIPGKQNNSTELLGYPVFKI